MGIRLLLGAWTAIVLKLEHVGGKNVDIRADGMVLQGSGMDIWRDLYGDHVDTGPLRTDRKDDKVQ